AKGKNVIPPITVPIELSSLHCEMYVAALEEPQRPGDVASKKDVLALLSKVINTLFKWPTFQYLQENDESIYASRTRSQF
ncbi:hypothetical protein EC991_006895, partial [Linnemannia zychae]